MASFQEAPTNEKMTTAMTATAMTATATAATATATEAAECMICYEPFNKSNHLCVECENGGCTSKACTACVRAYLLTSTNEPHCMECKQPWSPKFTLILTKKWLTETYRPHREKMIFEVELSKMPATMEAAEQYKGREKEKIVRQDLNIKIKALEVQLDELKTQIRLSYARERAPVGGGAAAAAAAPAAAEKKVFFMPCPALECKGMLSTQYKCGICDNYTCHDCHEIIGVQKTADHTCDLNNVASAQAIKKETKQCPGCNSRIFRTEGCSQMWCTGCHTAFDWHTGKKVVNERLHNPHWVEYQRSQNKDGAVQRAPGDVPCGGLCDNRDKVRIMNKLGLTHSTPLHHTVEGIYRLVGEISRNRVRTLRELCQAMQDYEPLRIRYIVGEISKAELSKNIFKQDKTRQKNTELVHVFELLSAVGIDLFQRLTMEVTYINEAELEWKNSNRNTMGSEWKNYVTAQEAGFRALVEAQIAEYNTLRLHCNALFAAISNTYSMTVPQIGEFATFSTTPGWRDLAIATAKFSGIGMRRVEKCAETAAQPGSTAEDPITVE